MAYRFKVNSQALRDLKEIGNFAHRGAGTESDEFAQRILAQAESLTTFPYRHGTWAKQPNIRKLPYKSYVIFYKIHDEEKMIEILRFWHAARDQRRLRLKEEASQPYGAAKVGA